MPTAAALRLEIEHALECRFPAALTPAPQSIREVAVTGIAAVDELLHGGLPAGAISELTGATSSGRTSLALRFVAQRTAEARACAWVDVNDAFDPESAAANGVQLRRLLWVRCRDEVGSAAARKISNGMGKWQTRPRWARLDEGLRATDLLLQGGWICGDCAGRGRHGAGAGEPHSVGHVVPLQAGGRAHAMQPGGAGHAGLCAVGGSGGAGMRGSARGSGGRNRAARVRICGPARAGTVCAGGDHDA